MEKNGGATWADQWDYNPDPVSVPDTKKKSGNNTSNYKQKVGEGLGKTKAVASIGVKKVKEGTAVGFQWIKDKYHKTTQKK
ncbi:hypothetical protein HS088_TW20G00472 [Tripterygium wilfordii]|uniref:Uncharacterized protein n=1 Tax=Tripterygium wilfordii TaxID=458696 RepID=A0A7J7C7L3_TRIWF|nr:uncharacterized protein LOC119987251 [Tripterygium wilfordii]KAF5730102.1 hypothetical protein HS088_TW20G00472 [Tripterygium wilfordii]